MDQRELAGDGEEALRAAIDGALLHTWTAMPGIVQKFYPERMTCDVQISVKLLQLVVNPKAVSPATITTPTWVSIPVVPDVPVVFMGGGGFSLTFEPTPGDECLLVFAARCRDGWWDVGSVQIQPELRHHSMSDGFCFIGPRSKPNILPSISPNAQLRSNDGSTYLEVTPGGEVNIVAPQGATITAGLASIQLSPSGAVSITAPGGVTITGDLSVTGNTIGTGDGTFVGIPVATHIHPGVTAGGSDTGAPIP